MHDDTLRKVALVWIFSCLATIGLSLPAQGSVVLNEVVIDSRGSNVSEKEYIELYSATPNQSLDGLSVIIIEGIDIPESKLKAGDIIRRWDFPKSAKTNSQGYYLLANELTQQSYRVTPDLVFDYENRLTNEPQTIALVATSSAPQIGKNISSVTIPEEHIFDAVGLNDAVGNARFYLNAPVLGPDQVYLAAGAVRVRDGVDTGDVSDWALADIEAPPTVTYNTPGSANRVGDSAVIIDEKSVTADPTVTSAPPQWNLYDPMKVENAINSQGSALVYIRSSKYEFCQTFENRYLLHPVAQPLLAGRPIFYMDVTNPGYGRLASELGIYRIPSMAFRKKNGEWEYLVSTPNTTGQEIYEFLQKR